MEKVRGGKGRGCDDDREKGCVDKKGKWLRGEEKGEGERGGKKERRTGDLRINALEFYI